MATRFYALCILAAIAHLASGQSPVNITVNSVPYDIQAVPTIPSGSSKSCGVALNSTRFPGTSQGSFPLAVSVPAGQRVRVIFANGNLNGKTTTAAGEPGVVILSNQTAIVQQVGGASPIVQNVSSAVSPTSAPASGQINQASPTQLSSGNPAPTARPGPPAPGAGGSSGSSPSPPGSSSTPASTPGSTTRSPPSGGGTPNTPSPPGGTPSTPSPPGGPAATPSPTTSSPGGPPGGQQTPSATPSTTPDDLSRCNSAANGHANEICPESACPDPCCNQKLECQGHRDQACVAAGQCTNPATASGACAGSCPTNSPPGNRKLLESFLGRTMLQATVPSGPNGGVIGYVQLYGSTTDNSLIAPDTQFGVPYIEFQAPTTKGQTVNFYGGLQFAQVVGGNPVFPFQPSTQLQNPACNIQVTFTSV